MTGWRRPLEGIASIKQKLSILIVAAVAMTAVASQIGVWLGWPVWIRPIVAGAAALLMVQFLARGLTKPLRTMAEATTAMARGDYTRRVETTGRDEVALLARSFNAMSSELAETDRLRKEFVANASHELRTPVAALRSTLENLVDGVGRPDQETLARMLARAEHLSNLVGQLLDLSRLDSGVETEPLAQVDLGHLLNDVVGEVAEAHPGVDIQIRTPIDVEIEARPGRLRQVFVNIIGNAARFSDRGEPVLVTVTQDGDRAGVTVRDTGPGIPKAEHGRVFERFWQADGTRTGSGGAGLGLAISKQVIDQHGGTIEVSANKPNGACFVITLPRHSPPDTAADAAPALPLAGEPQLG